MLGVTLIAASGVRSVVHDSTGEVCDGHAWIGSYFGARRALRSAPVRQALDAIALEVERISEAQRFTTKLLADRSPIILPRTEPRSITPH